MSDLSITTNCDAVAAKIDAINADITASRSKLFAALAGPLVNDVKNRITSQDNGRWARMSKWTQAKKNVERPLQGAEEFVKAQISASQLKIVGETGSDWTLTQHDEGFENKQDHFDGARVEIEIVNPGPLGLGAVPSGKFSWVPHNGAGRTPARKIWASEAEARAIVQPIAQRWLQAIVNAHADGGSNG